MINRNDDPELRANVTAEIDQILAMHPLGRDYLATQADLLSEGLEDHALDGAIQAIAGHLEGKCRSRSVSLRSAEERAASSRG